MLAVDTLGLAFIYFNNLYSPQNSSNIGTVRPGFLGRRRVAQGRRIIKKSGRRTLKIQGGASLKIQGGRTNEGA
jgi:hypothetical protein